MFLYHLNHSFANQSIVSHQDNNLVIGNYMINKESWWEKDSQRNYYLVLGETIHWPHLYKIGQAPAELISYLLNEESSNKLKNTLLSSTTLSLIHHLVYEYYTTYSNIIKLYLPNDISQLFKKWIISKQKTQHNKQTLIIMPDRWTIVNQQELYQYTLDQAIGSQHTISQDIKLFWNIKYGYKQIIICTPGECFWDYSNLSQIILIDPHKRYYKSQQEPRYDIARVCELMAHYYDCALNINTTNLLNHIWSTS